MREKQDLHEHRLWLFNWNRIGVYSIFWYYRSFCKYSVEFATIHFYYVADLASGQVEANPLFLLATRDCRFVLAQANFFGEIFWPYNKSSDIILVLVFWNEVEVNRHGK